MSIPYDEEPGPKTRNRPINFRLSRSLAGTSHSETCLKIAVTSLKEVTATLLTMLMLTGRIDPATNRQNAVYIWRATEHTGTWI